MVRRKGGNERLAERGGQKSSFCDCLHNATTRPSIASREEVDDVIMETTQSSNLNNLHESLDLCSSNETSADYYFDSYAHSGNPLLRSEFDAVLSIIGSFAFVWLIVMV